ncbi:hypothetical protein V1511DRAFT_511681 [Dipodascopsis uninucleata]
MARLGGGGGPSRRSTINPAPRTEAAKQALRSFYCDLCQKGYSRMDEYENHTNSYEHQHRKRFLELRQMQRDSSSIAQRREREAKESGMRAISIESVEKPSDSNNTSNSSGTGTKAGFKAIGGGFKRIGSKKESATIANAAGKSELIASESINKKYESGSDSEEDTDYTRYDPNQPTD